MQYLKNYCYLCAAFRYKQNLYIFYYMGILQERLAKYDRPQKYKKLGIYPYFREIEGKQGTEVIMEGHRVLMFGSNAYTGLTGDDRVIEAGIKAMRQYGSGCAGSRFLNGTLDLHVQLEKELAEFVGKEESMCFATGFTVNSGVLGVLTDRHDYIICDDRDHASIVDGVRNSFSQRLKYKHNDMAELESLLQRCPEDVVKLIVVDGVFSMEGDLCKLPEIIALKHKYPGTAVMVDEAHGLGVFGRQGRGVCDHFGLTDEVDLIMGTFSKSLASIGGYVAGDYRVIDYVRHASRPFIFCASIPPASCATALEALHILEESPELPKRLMALAAHMRSGLKARGIAIRDSITPIIPIYTYENERTFIKAKELYEEGVYVNPVLPPATPEGECLLRTSYMATHTEALLDEALDIIERVIGPSEKHE